MLTLTCDDRYVVELTSIALNLRMRTDGHAPLGEVGTPGNLASPFHGASKIDDTQAKDLKDGRWYFNLHSKNFSSGEIRGSVVRR